jgi:hypothetical protein
VAAKGVANVRSVVVPLAAEVAAPMAVLVLCDDGQEGRALSYSELQNGDLILLAPKLDRS